MPPVSVSPPCVCQVWSCGDNREGQLGLGAPHEVVTAVQSQVSAPLQRFLALHKAQSKKAGPGRHRDAAVSQHLRSLMQPVGGAAAASGGVGAFMQQASSSNGGSGSSVAWAFTSGTAGAEATAEGAMMALNFGGADMERHLLAAGLQAGQLSAPARLGHGSHLLAQAASGPTGRWPQVALTSGDAMVLGECAEIPLHQECWEYIAVTVHSQLWSR